MKRATDPMPLTAIAPWFGAKRTLAPLIVQELGPHQSYWEPFCGSMAVLLAKPPCRMETVNDLHADLINLARVIQDRPACCRLYRRLRRVLMHEDLIGEAKERCRGGLSPSRQPMGEGDGIADEERAYWFFLRSWIGRNGTGGTAETNQHFCRRFTANGGAPAVRLASAVRSVPQWRRRLSRVCILRMDGFEMLERVEDAATAAIYVDPPYLVKNARYVHDFSADDHRRLAALLGRFKRARVVVSYYEHPDVAGLYPDWTVRRCPIVKAMSGVRQGESRKVVAPEVLLINGPSLAAPAGRSAALPSEPLFERDFALPAGGGATCD